MRVIAKTGTAASRHARSRVARPAPVIRHAGLVPCVSFGIALLAVSFAPRTEAGPRALDDPSIRDAIDDAFFVDPVVPYDRIDVQTHDGIVTLEGTVTNLLASDRATQIAETVKGVRSVVNRIDIEPATQRSDGAIRSDIQAALAADAATEGYEVGVSVDHGAVTLSGTVDSWEEKYLSNQVARGVRGVVEVTDRIEVDRDTTRTDSQIRHEVIAALRWDTLIDGALIDVAVHDGVVTLSGTVGSAAEKTRALMHGWTAGVIQVNADGLAVERWARDPDLRAGKYADVTDTEIRQAIEDALRHDPRVRSSDLEPGVHLGRVTLRGTVESPAEKRAAIRDARNTVGVIDVEDRIKIRTAVDVDDRELERTIEQALLRNPYVSRFEISVDVLNGVARLSGQVDTDFEKARAGDIAERIAGVTWVDNDLSVSDPRQVPELDPYVDGHDAWDYEWFNYDPAPLPVSDAALTANIENELWWSPYVDSEDVTVEVDEGVATLTGTVDSWSERRAATENAYDGGALRVVNQLVVALR
ncbi:MAG: BON domain-containing protein [Candidatus Eiseniibacteriota bacterium]|jgi:osmotically-inducible protein OsmY